MSNQNQRFEQLLQINRKLNISDDLDSVLDRILTESRNLSNSEAGTLYLREGDELVFSHTQNERLFTSHLDNKNNYQNQKIRVNEKSISGFVAMSSHDHTQKILNITDVYQLSNDHPFSFDKSFDSKNDYRTQSMMVAPINNAVGDNIGVIQMINRKNQQNDIIPYELDDEIILASFADLAAMHIERANTAKEMILRMIKMAELRDPKETGAHVNRVGAYSAELYEHWAMKNGIDIQEIKKVKGEYRMASMLHDVGKVGISDTILKKPAPFNEEEREIMKNHTIYGARLFEYSASSMDKLASEISISHHENWDGSGYPGKNNNEQTMKHYSNTISGESIPLSGRIVRITDVYDALISKRCYKDPWKEQDVIDEIQKNSGIEFDPVLVDYFFDIYDTIKAIHSKYKENE